MQSQKATAVKFLMNWGCMGSLALKMQAASKGIRASILFLKDH